MIFRTFIYHLFFFHFPFFLLQVRRKYKQLAESNFLAYVTPRALVNIPSNLCIYIYSHFLFSCFASYSPFSVQLFRQLQLAFERRAFLNRTNVGRRINQSLFSSIPDLRQIFLLVYIFNFNSLKIPSWFNEIVKLLFIVFVVNV